VTESAPDKEEFVPFCPLEVKKLTPPAPIVTVTGLVGQVVEFVK
jgi:hypothetical protein